MKVLVYNWCPLWSTEGGGVALYIRNLIDGLAGRCEVVFLNSGFYYDGNDRPYIRESDNNPFNEVSSYDLVNSPMMAPMKSPADNIRRFLEDDTLIPIFRDFLEEHEIDVVHFNNLEGLTVPCLSVKEELSEVRFVYSIHNYALFCPAVNYWTSDGKNCYAGDSRDCVKCMAKYRLPKTPTRRRFRMRESGKAYLLGRLETHVLNAAAYKLTGNAYDDDRCGELFIRYRAEQVDAVNRYFDAVHAVSRRVAEIALSNGLERSKLHVAYIGTKFAGRQTAPREKEPGNLFGIVFMGYMKREKGLPFLVESLSHMDDGALSGIALTVAAKLSDPCLYVDLRKLAKRLGGYRYFDGYMHEQIPEILDGADIGVVPVLWEDNMPQVAMEYASSGVPVLASSFGGAGEITGSQLFTFEGGDEADFIAHIERFMENRSELARYWDGMMELPSVEAHLDEMMRLYGGDVS